MSTDITILLLIAIIEAMMIGLLLSDKLGLIKNKEIENEPKDNRQDTDNTEKPRRSSD